MIALALAASTTGLEVTYVKPSVAEDVLKESIKIAELPDFFQRSPLLAADAPAPGRGRGHLGVHDGGE